MEKKYFYTCPKTGFGANISHAICPSNNPEKLLILLAISKRGIYARDCTVLKASKNNW